MNRYLRALLTAVALAVSYGAKSAPSYVSVVVDKVNYNQDYVIGVDVNYYGQANDIVGVSANHHSIGQRSFGTWGLNRLSDGRWWEWAPSRIPMSSGPITGTVSITEQNSNDVTTEFDVFNFRPDEEMAIPTWTISKEQSSYKINTLGVSGADYYNLWLWDWTELKYVSSQQVANITDLQSISFDGLVDGRTYNIYLIANHRFLEDSAGFSTSILVRSYDLQYLTYSATARAVPEPETCSLVLAGLALIGGLLRPKASKRNPQLADRGV